MLYLRIALFRYFSELYIIFGNYKWYIIYFFNKYIKNPNSYIIRIKNKKYIFYKYKIYNILYIYSFTI